MFAISILFFAILLLGGCDRLSQIAHEPQIIKKQQKEIAALNAQIHSLQLQLTGVTQDFKSESINNQHTMSTFDSSFHVLATKYAELDSDANKYRTCILNNTSKAIHRLDTNFGFLYISSNGIASDHKHCKLSLNIGNPYMSEVSGFTLNMRYGPSFNPSGPDSYTHWFKSLISLSKSFTKPLRPGQWNKLEIPLATLKPDDVKYIRLEITIDNIILTNQ
ncbi:MAG: hypothetical protein ACP5IL_09710 [Syntrophobacteraceae bacterium]